MKPGCPIRWNCWTRPSALRMFLEMQEFYRILRNFEPFGRHFTHYPHGMFSDYCMNKPKAGQCEIVLENMLKRVKASWTFGILWSSLVPFSNHCIWIFPKYRKPHCTVSSDVTGMWGEEIRFLVGALQAKLPCAAKRVLSIITCETHVFCVRNPHLF